MLKKIFKASLASALVGTLFFLFPPHFPTASAEDTTFQVNVEEILSVAITTPTSWARGEVGDFLRNKVTIGVTSNNASGFTAGMTTSGSSTDLTHSSKANTTLPTINNVSGYTCAGDLNCSAFSANQWGYSLDDSDSHTGQYLPMVNSSAAPITITSSSTATSKSQDVYFGAKANISQASGTYTGTVVISVVSGTSGNPLPAPSGSDPTPVGPSADQTAEYTPAPVNATAYTYTTRDTSAGTTTTTTQVTPGDNESLYDTYTPPQGVTDSTSSNIYDGSMLTTGLAITASVAAGAGIFFFVLAKRKKDDEEEEIE